MIWANQAGRTLLSPPPPDAIFSQELVTDTGVRSSCFFQASPHDTFASSPNKGVHRDAIMPDLRAPMNLKNWRERGTDMLGIFFRGVDA